MQITPYHAKYYARLLDRSVASNSVEKIIATLSDAQVDINPHQIEAALFAFRSPFSKGIVMGDEVGLGKTIEAGIVIAQKWAEQKRKILVIVPANLKTQWQVELEEKFYLPSIVMDSEIFKQCKKNGNNNPFEQDKIVIVSYHYAYDKNDFLKDVAWDLAVMDEAHKVRKDGDIVKWLRPASHQFKIHYRGGKLYEPDFVAETADEIFIVEVKSYRETDDEDVVLKGKAAQKYCEYVNEYVNRERGKKWRYVLFEESTIKRSSSFAGLVREARKYIFD